MNHDLAPRWWRDCARAVLLLAAAGLMLPGAQAARPLATDDAGTAGRGDCELEAAVERVRAGEARARGDGLRLACGVGAGLQLALGAGRQRVRDGDAEAVRIQGLEVSAKWAAWEHEGAALALSRSAARERERGGADGWKGAGQELRVIHSRPLGQRWTLHLNLGHARGPRPDPVRSTPWGVAVEHAGTAGGMVPVAELYGDDREPPFWTVGLRQSLADGRLVLDLGYGRQIAGGRPWGWTAGLKATF